MFGKKFLLESILERRSFTIAARRDLRAVRRKTDRIKIFRSSKKGNISGCDFSLFLVCESGNGNVFERTDKNS
ncbi:hypothetical protein DLM77_11845 [Leptospira yasudae]|uniref:Uncharacterized protein n=1 Tax=Leptospira yasudae TaxID=2202201 RepID=A0ABX9M277_9LEPT|nr:hypothetical protein DLM77_11845 [Leptospira yasudae]